MFTDPLAVTYDGSAKSLPRISGNRLGTVYRTADSEFEMNISNVAPKPRNSETWRYVFLSRRVSDPTPSDVFDNFRWIRNGFGYFYVFDSPTRAEASVDIPRLRTALDSFLTPGFQTRVMGGEQ